MDDAPNPVYTAEILDTKLCTFREEPRGTTREQVEIREETKLWKTE